MKKANLYFIFFAFVVLTLSFYSCAENAGGEYRLSEGQCIKNFSIKDLGHNKYNIIIVDEDNQRVDVLGQKFDDTISVNVGSSTMNLVFKDKKVILNYNNNNCTYEKME